MDRRLVTLLSRSLPLGLMISYASSSRAAEVDLGVAMKGFGDSFPSETKAGNSTESSVSPQPRTLSQFLDRPKIRQPDPLTHGF